MTVLVTGATGLIGSALVKLLMKEGRPVRALVRDEARARPQLPPAVELALGDVTDPATLRGAMRGIELVFHAAGMPEQWQRDPTIFDRVNGQGTANVLAAAGAEGVRRVVYTSTMDVFEAPPGGTVVETRIARQPKHTAYERSKQAAEREVERFLSRGLDVVLVNPSATFGPSPSHVGLNSFFIKLLTGKLPLLPPGGMSVVYIEGLARAHLLAAERGRTGERYLLSDYFVTNRRFAAEICAAAGGKHVPPVAPAWLMKGVSAALEPLARAFRFTPLIAKGQLAFVLWQANVDSSKAERELGFVPTPLSEGVRSTVAFLRNEGLVPG